MNFEETKVVSIQSWRPNPKTKKQNENENNIKFFRNANILKFGELMNQTKLSKLGKLCVFIRFIYNNVCLPG